MDFLNNGIAQVRDLFLSMTPGARIVAGLLLAVVVVSMGFLFQHSSTGPDTYLFGGEYLPASDLNKIDAAISARGLTAVREGNRIRVPAGQYAEYMAAIADADALPRNFHDLLENALDKGGVWESRNMTQQRLRIAKEQTLSEVIRAMSWVDDAIVMYDEQQASGINGRKQVVASVNVMPINGETVTYERRKRLQKAVAHAVLGLKPDAVEVVSLGDDTSFADGGMSPEMFENDYLRARAMFNNDQRQKILKVVGYIPGVRVEVNADLENVSQERSQSIQPGKAAVALAEQTSEDKQTRITTDNSGRPGLVAQGPVRDQEGLASTTNKDETKSSTAQSHNIVEQTNSQILKEGYVPKSAWASVAVPRSHLTDIWKQRNPGAAGQPEQGEVAVIEDEVKRTLEKLVEPLLPGHVAGEDSFKYVTVQFYDAIVPAPIPAPSFANTAMAWTGQNWGRLSMMLLAVVSLMMLRSMASSPLPAGSNESAAGLTLDIASNEDGEASDGAGEVGDDRPKLRLKKGPSLKDDLAEMVREDPDAAATILKNWIGKAA